ncbi:MAG TPA: OmpA family protein [Terriglobales bacterium]|nr:OmpA family protein [Terriglobales bacterium]
MRTILPAVLLATSAIWAQDQTTAPVNQPPQTETQQQPAVVQQPAPPQQTQPAAPAAEVSAQPKPQAAIARTNLVELFNGPTMSEIYCAGFFTKESVRGTGTVLAGNHSPEAAHYVDHDYIYLAGNEVQEGKEYLLLRHTMDPNEYESFPGQLGMVRRLGEMYQDLGRAKVLYFRDRVAVAQIESSCADAMPGDIVVPFQERPRPEFKHTTFERFPQPNGKTSGRIVMGKDLDTEIGDHRIVYLNVGEAQGVKPGDYFRITREYSSVASSQIDSLSFSAPSNDPSQKDPSRFNFRRNAGALPRLAVGELMVINTTNNSATALTTFTPEDIHLGDHVEMIDATPIAKAEPEPAAPPEPPTINCSVSRTTIQVGESSNITCNGVAEEGHTVTYSYQASAGQITPRESRATLVGTAPGPVTVTATALDDRNLSAQTTLNIDVQASPVAPSATPVTPAMLNELNFKPNSTYVDNRAKAVLDDDALRLQREANATVILEGSASPSENDALALQRAENAKTYLSKSKGIDASRIQTRPAPNKNGAKVGVIMVPAGANHQ